MRLSIAEIFKYADCTCTSRNFSEGEKLLNSDYIVKCGRLGSEANTYKIMAFCRQHSCKNAKPHEISGSIETNGSITSFVCSCKAGLSGKCKHILAVLLFCNRNDVNDINVLSSTDVKCAWKNSSVKRSEQNKALPFCDIECYKGSFRDVDALPVTEAQKEELEQLIKSYMADNNALAKHKLGRHACVELPSDEIQITEKDLQVIKAIVCNPQSNCMIHISNIPFPCMNECCLERIQKLYDEDPVLLFHNSRQSFEKWLQIRQYRISGSRIYKIYTYCFNANPDWEKKAISYFYPDTFHSQYTVHGKTYEKKAIEEYEKHKNITVTTCGAVISPLNPWLSYSPDGIVMKDGKPHTLIEVKCPWAGKTKSIGDIIGKVKFLEIKNNLLCFKENHEYYCQVQMGMSMLNVNSTDFIVYSSYDDSFALIEIPFNEKYIIKVLSQVKNMYSRMLHYVCLHEKENENV